MILNARALTIGKTDRRNDDMCFYVRLFQAQVLGVLGDFTSDSPQGANEACASHLQAFIADKLATWREMLLPPERLLPLLLRKTNDWLADFGRKAQTTLIVFIWDLRAETCHFISVGDSGLACVGPEGVRYLREGDREGLRSAAGFLPGQVDGTVMVTQMRSDETLLAFTDGFWENTKAFMNDALLVEACKAGSLAELDARIHHQILEPAIRKDDLSILLMKGEAMDGQIQPHVDQETLEKLVRASVEQQVNTLIGSGQASAPTPLERDLLKFLDDGPVLERRLLEALVPQVNQQVEKRLVALLEEQNKKLQNTVAEQTRILSAQIADQEARVNELKVLVAKQAQTRGHFVEESKAPKPSRNAGKSKADQTSSPADGEKASASTPNTLKGRNDIPLFENKGLMLNLIIAVVVVIGVGLFVKLTFFGAKAPVTDGTPTEQSAQNPATTDTGIVPGPDDPEPEPPAKIDYAAAPISRDLLAVMGIDHMTYQRETAELQRLLNELPAGDPPGPVVLKHSSLGDLSLKLPEAAKWLSTRPVSNKIVAKLWLQARSGATLDGYPGNGARTKFAARFKASLDSRKELAAACTKGQTGLLDEAVAKAFPEVKTVWLQELMSIATKIKKKGPNKERLPIAFYRGKRYLSTTVLFKDTAMSSWLVKVSTKGQLETGDIDIYIRAVWLAAQVEVPESGGQLSDELIKAVAPLGNKTCEDIFNEGLAQWK